MKKGKNAFFDGKDWKEGSKESKMDNGKDSGKQKGPQLELRDSMSPKTGGSNGGHYQYRKGRGKGGPDFLSPKFPTPYPTSTPVEDKEPPPIENAQY